MHYLIIIAIIAIIVVIQFRFYSDTKQKISHLKWIFPGKDDKYKLNSLKDEEYNCKVKDIEDANFEEIVQLCEKYNLDSAKFIYSVKDEEGVEHTYIGKGVQSALISTITAGISVNHNNSTLNIIVGSINDYLNNNKTVSDFHLMKDIVDRNCDSFEEEINTQIPIPLYLGLVGTMVGILFGIGYLVITGDLNIMLGTPIPNWIQSIRSFFNIENAGGIENLMGGVALAMISSILGIIFTTYGSIKFKTAKSVVEANKHAFLSWIQAKLLPTLSDNVVGAIREMTENLDNFNRQFAQNTGNLGLALEKVNDSYKMQVQLLASVRQIADKDLTQQNLQLYTALQNSTVEIGTLGEYLKNSNQYLSNVQALNKKLDDYENRTQFIENASKFYSKHENWLAENYDEANRKLQEVVGKYNIAIEQTFDKIKSDIDSKRQELGTFVENQNSALKHSASDLDKIVKALSELGEVQKAVKAFESAIKGQNAKLDRLTEHIEKLANAKSSGGNVQIKQKTPIWQIALLSIITLSCSVLAVNSFIKFEPKAEKKEIIQSQPVIQLPVVPPIIDSVEVADTVVVSQKK